MPMKGSLQLKMIDFNKISVNQIMHISQVINDSSLMQQEFIAARYAKTMPNYQTTIEFLTELKLIGVIKDLIVIKPAYGKFLQEIQHSSHPKEVTISFIIKKMFDSPNKIGDYAKQFLSVFSLRDEYYELKPTLKQKLEYSGIRNFFMDLRLLEYDSTNTRYIVQDNFILAYPEFKGGFHASEDSFKRIRKLKEKIGRAAELKIIEYEKKRLCDFPQIIEKIEHTAIKDVSAGYDIKSYDYTNNQEFVSRLIEVKAVSSWNYRFYWSNNEIETSKLNRETYYLYLLPVKTRGEFDIENMKIINDPFLNVYNNKDAWSSMVETLSYTLRNNE